MSIYETVFITRQDLTDGQVKELTETMSEILKKEGGKILKTEQWGLRTLAYRINKSKKGHYTLIESDAPGPAIIEMERNLRLNEDVMRFMSLKLDAASEGSSIIVDRDKSRNENYENKEEAA